MIQVATFGILIAEDDFSGTDPIAYRSATVHGNETDMKEVAQNLNLGAKLLADSIDRARS